MKCQILHESKGRMRIHFCISRMSLSQADLAEYYLRGVCGVADVKVFDRTADAVVFYSCKRSAVIAALSAFSFEKAENAELVPVNTSRALNREFEDRLVFSVIRRFASKLFLPSVIRSAIAVFRSVKYIKAGVKSLLAGKLSVSVLDATAVSVSILRGDFSTAASVMFMLGLGEMLEDWTHKKSVSDLAGAMSLNVDKVWLKAEEGEILVPVGDISAGDKIVVRTGNMIPLDGKVYEGEALVNQASMTGESLPVDKTVGDAVSSGTVNQFGAFEMEATKVGEDSSIQRMIRLVQSADADKAKIVGLADLWATWIVVIALTAAALTWLISGEIIRAVTILVVFCPCALVLATPTAIMAAIGNATKRGFLVREGDALERLAAVKKIAFDKTGTLTYGTPKVVLVHSALPALSDNELYRLCAAAERYSEHPLGKAITRCCQQETGITLEEAENFQMVPGRGVSACVDGKTLLAGNAELLAEHHIAIPEEAAKAAVVQLSQGCTVTYAAVDAADIALVDDEVKELPHPHRALQAHNAHHQAQYNILAHAQLHRHRARHHRHTEPCCRRAGP